MTSSNMLRFVILLGAISSCKTFNRSKSSSSKPKDTSAVKSTTADACLRFNLADIPTIDAAALNVSDVKVQAINDNHGVAGIKISAVRDINADNMFYQACPEGVESGHESCVEGLLDELDPESSEARMKNDFRLQAGLNKIRVLSCVWEDHNSNPKATFYKVPERPEEKLYCGVAKEKRFSQSPNDRKNESYMIRMEIAQQELALKRYCHRMIRAQNRYEKSDPATHHPEVEESVKASLYLRDDYCIAAASSLSLQTLNIATQRLAYQLEQPGFGLTDPVQVKKLEAESCLTEDKLQDALKENSITKSTLSGSTSEEEGKEKIETLEPAAGTPSNPGFATADVSSTSQISSPGCETGETLENFTPTDSGSDPSYKRHCQSDKDMEWVEPTADGTEPYCRERTGASINSGDFADSEAVQDSLLPSDSKQISSWRRVVGGTMIGMGLVAGVATGVMVTRSKRLGASGLAGIFAGVIVGSVIAIGGYQYAGGFKLTGEAPVEAPLDLELYTTMNTLGACFIENKASLDAVSDDVSL